MCISPEVRGEAVNGISLYLHGKVIPSPGCNSLAMSNLLFCMTISSSRTVPNVALRAQLTKTSLIGMLPATETMKSVENGSEGLVEPV